MLQVAAAAALHPAVCYFYESVKIPEDRKWWCQKWLHFGFAFFLFVYFWQTTTAATTPPVEYYKNDVFIYGPFGILTGSCYGQ